MRIMKKLVWLLLISSCLAQSGGGKGTIINGRLPTVTSHRYMHITRLDGPAQAPEADLGWTQPATGCTGNETCTYSVYRGPSTGTETLLKAGINALTYVDLTVTRGSFYCYYVTATNGVGESLPSNEQCGTDPVVPSAPTGLTVTFK